MWCVSAMGGCPLVPCCAFCFVLVCQPFPHRVALSVLFFLSQPSIHQAIEQYTIAIDDDQANHILYSNRSAAYAAKKEFADALVDADLCVAREPKWAKGHFRRGLALEGLERYTDAFAAYEAGLLIEPADPLLLKSRADLSVMLEEMRATGTEVAAAAQNPQHERFSRLLAWLKEGKSKFPKLYLQYYSDEYRGVHCAARIPEDEVVLEVCERVGVRSM
jgi:tetratricopeptide (TPR) repeat protein